MTCAKLRLLRFPNSKYAVVVWREHHRLHNRSEIPATAVDFATVRLAVGQVLAEGFLVDRLRAFHDRYPAIDLEVIGGSRVVSLAKREADVALRYGEG